MGKGPSICLVTAYDGAVRELGDFTSGVDREYCGKQGYDIRVFTEGFDKERPPAWSKLLFVREVLRDYDYVMWIDADAVVTNHDVRVESFLEREGDIFLCLEEKAFPMFNTGVFVLGRCEWSFWLLDQMWSFPRWPESPYREQGVFNMMVEGGVVGSHMAFYPMRAFNSKAVPTEPWHEDDRVRWRKGDFVAHEFGGTVSAEKLANLKRCFSDV